MNLDDVGLYLPKYLTASEEKELLDDLRKFPNDIENKMYSDFGKETELYQGDGVSGFLIVNLPDNQVRPGNAIIISNSCDIYEKNERIFPSHICYAPIFNLEKYIQALQKNEIYSPDKITTHIDDIRKQRITQIFYLPDTGNSIGDSIVFLDRINNCPNKLIGRDELKKVRLFSLSTVGFYVFLIKLSIHFTRVRENINRF
jgi:hypothetical protein